MTALATLRRLRAHMICVAADAYERGNIALAAQAMRAADDLENHIGRITSNG